MRPDDIKVSDIPVVVRTRRDSMHRHRWEFADACISNQLVINEIFNAVEVSERTRRLSLVRPDFKTIGQMPKHQQHDLLSRYLDVIENEMSNAVLLHSPCFWIILDRWMSPTEVYRKLGDGFNRHHSENISCLLFMKYGDTSAKDVFDSRAEGYKFCLDRFSYQFNTAGDIVVLKKLSKDLYNNPNPILKRFTAKDVSDYLKLKGSCLEYAYVIQAMRKVGAGVELEWNEERSSFDYFVRGDTDILVMLYEARRSNERSFVTKYGSWQDILMKDVSGPAIIAGRFNVDVTSEPLSGVPVELAEYHHFTAHNKYTLGAIDVNSFLTTHNHLLKSFESFYGIELGEFSICMACLTNMALEQDGDFRSEVNSERRGRGIKCFLANVFNVLEFGYVDIPIHRDLLVDIIRRYADASFSSYFVSHQVVHRFIDIVSCDGDKRGDISLKSGGVRYPLIHRAGGYILDFAAIETFVENLFFGMRHNDKKGLTFEDDLKAAFKKVGVEVLDVDEITWGDGSVREVDLAVVRDNVLYLIECRSLAQSLSYFRGDPKSFNFRQEKLAEKITQGKTLWEKVSANPIGSNFDFSGYDFIDWRVASPFVEFSWNVNSELFDPQGVSRLMSASEVVAWVKNGVTPSPVHEAIVRDRLAAKFFS